MHFFVKRKNRPPLPAASCPIRRNTRFLPSLWSPLQRQLASCGLTKASPQQWIGTIRNLQKKGVSAVEIEWSEILPWLGEVPESGEDFSRTGCVCRRSRRQASSRAGKAVAARRISRRTSTSLNQSHPASWFFNVTSATSMPQVRYEKQPRPAEFPPAVVVNGRREVKVLHYRDRTFGICIWLHVEVDTGLFGRHRYWSLSVPRGGKNLATHPVGRRFLSGQEVLAYGRALVGRMARRLSQDGFIGQTKSLNHFTRYALPGGDNYTEWLITAPNLADRYWGEHFDLPNIVAHVRTSERKTPHGTHVLLMEEIQSDWNQALREAIRQSQQPRPAVELIEVEWDEDIAAPPDNPYLNHWLDAALRMMLLLAANQGFAGIAWLPGTLHAERFPWANAEGLKAFYDRIVPAAVESSPNPGACNWAWRSLKP
ncbi:MAG: hypothetical protein IPJ52_01910 [Rhodocyclaceae bacterium]|nr:hypothetical protein [Rhodocyclaceae bacterium]